DCRARPAAGGHGGRGRPARPPPPGAAARRPCRHGRTAPPHREGRPGRHREAPPGERPSEALPEAPPGLRAVPALLADRPVWAVGQAEQVEDGCPVAGGLPPDDLVGGEKPGELDLGYISKVKEKMLWVPQAQSGRVPSAMRRGRAVVE